MPDEERIPNNINATLTTWRTEALRAPARPFKVKPEVVASKWPDDQSRAAAVDLAGRGIDIPWSYGEVFGESEFKVIGLRSGGIGLVYFVESSMNEGKRLYAAKTLQSFLKPDYLDLAPSFQEEIARAFLEETLPWLEMDRHSHIITVHMLENVLHPVLNRNIPFVYSEYVPGGNLRQYFKEKGTLKYRETLTLGIQLCEGLNHAYKHGLEAHKDIKPDNVMVGGEGTFKLTDFSTNVIGTPGYMAPEQVVGLWMMWGEEIEPGNNPVDHRADQFAVGMVVLESYLGSHPFPICREACLERESAESFARDGVGEIEDDSLPEMFRKILVRIFSTEPEDRYRNVSDLKKALMAAHEEGFGTYDKPFVEEDDSAEWWFNRGKAFMTLGRWVLAEAPLMEALERYRNSSGVGTETARCLMDLGLVYARTGKYVDAEHVLSDAMKIYGHIPKSDLEQANCIMILGNVYRLTARFSEAEKVFNDALGTYRNTPGAERDLANCIMNLGNIYGLTGRRNEAEKAYKEALKIYRRIPGTDRHQAPCIENLAIVYSETGHFNKAEDAYREALRIYRRLPGEEMSVAKCTMNLGNVFCETGRFKESEKAFEETLRTYCQIPGTERDQTVCNENLAVVFYETGRIAEAEVAFEEVLRRYTRIAGTEIRQANCKLYLGRIFREKDNLPKAEKVLEEALEILNCFRGIKRMQAKCGMELGILYRITGRLEKAVNILKESIDNLHGIAGSEIAETKCMVELARTCLLLKDYARARSLTEEALKLSESLPRELVDMIRADGLRLLEDLDDTLRPPTKEK